MEDEADGVSFTEFRFSSAQSAPPIKKWSMIPAEQPKFRSDQPSSVSFFRPFCVVPVAAVAVAVAVPSAVAVPVSPGCQSEAVPA